MTDHVEASFHWADYVVFSLSLVMGLLVGVIFLFKGRGGQKEGTDDYLLGGRDMGPVTVGASMLASTLNAVFLLGGTAEVYYRGAIYGLMAVGLIPLLGIVVVFFVPIWRRVNMTSAYEYLDKRYDSLMMRLWGATLFSFKLILFLAVVFYTPAMALSQVTGINIHVAIVVCGVVCALYTILGGLKAVIWTDTIQAAIMLIGLFLLCIMGSIEAGGSSNVVNIAKAEGRFNFNNWNPDPRERHTVWGLTFGYCVTWMLGYLSDQVLVQRYLSVKSVRAAQMAVLVNIVVAIICAALVVAVGVISFAYYIDCDPFVEGEITAGDQLLPFFFMELLGPYKGLPGLFISSIFAAALSTVSSSINSLSAVFLEDFLKPAMSAMGKPMAKSKETVYAKILSAIFGVLAIALSYIAPLFGNAIIQVPTTVYGAIGGPLFSLFFLGFFVPFAEKWGALTGSLVGLILDLWIGIGAIAHGTPASVDNLPVGMCLGNGTAITLAPVTGTTLMPIQPDENPLKPLYDLSYCWMGVIGSVSSILVGVLVSLLVNKLGYGRKEEIDSLLLFRWSDYYGANSKCQATITPADDTESGGKKPHADEKNGEVGNGESKANVNGNEKGGTNGVQNPAYDPDDMTPIKL